MRRVCLVLWMTFCTAFAGFGIYLAANQSLKLTQSAPVMATVLRTEIETRRSRDRSSRNATRTTVSYRPVVEYQYVVDDSTRLSKTVFPMDVGWGGRSGRRWARRIVEQFEEGQRVRAYYNPERPGEAFLLKQPSAFPYLFVLAPAILGMAGLGFLRKSAQPMSPAAKRRAALYVAAVWHGVGALCATHYFWLSGSQYEYSALPIFGAYTILGVAPVVFALPSEGLAGRLRAGGFFLLIGAFLGLWAGLCSGWLAGLISGENVDGSSWTWCGVLIGAGLLALLGLISGKVKGQ